MCGFSGSVVPRTASLLAHRGPDGSGSIGEALPWANVSLEMTRLAVVDQRQLDVPFDFRRSCGVVLAYNGELYRWRDLRAELADGTPWETDCDAEVVARAWRRWGPDMLPRLNGMWGMFLVDTREGVVFLARDRAGEKPLYYAPFGSGVAFASEIKALPIRLEEAPCPDADVFEFDCLETTPFRDVCALGPGQYILLRSPADLPPAPVTWWTLPAEIDDGMTWERAVEETQALIVDAVQIRIPDQVPYGVQVSGGLDSAIIQTVARCERTYTVTFPDDGVDCLPLARLAAGREPTAVTFGYRDLVEALPKVAYHLDTPATWTACCQWFLDGTMARDGCVVVLSGEGADELFLGYSRCRLLAWIERAAADPRLSAYRFTHERLLGTDDEILARLLDRSPNGRCRDHALALVRRLAGDGSLLQRVMRLEFASTMQVLLRMGDRMAAAFSMENRSPFLDYRLMELAARTPTRWKVTERDSKAVLCEVARRLGVPREVVEQPTKKGLYVPWARWTGAAGWDRGGFAEMMRAAWRAAFSLPHG